MAEPSDSLDALLELVRPIEDVEQAQSLSRLEATLFRRPLRPIALGRYVLLRRLGHGAHGIVYAAYDPQLEREVAVKLVRAIGGRAHADEHHRLAAEARALARLRHPNIITVHDVGVFGGDSDPSASASSGLTEPGVFVVMELVRGPTLAEWLTQSHRSLADVLRVFRAAGLGLAAAHEAGIVHRDFKPANVLVDRDGRVFVTDFGLAHSIARPTASDAMSSEGSGTPEFMAPEQRGGAPAAASADQYAYCVALRSALATTHPHRPLPRRLRSIIAKGTATEPGERFGDMTSLVRTLDEGRQRRRWGAVASMAIAAVGVVAFATQGERHCAGIDGQLEGTWGALQRTELHVRFGQASERVVSGIDAYASEWFAAYREVCEAVHVRSELSVTSAEPRFACLQRRRRSLAAALPIVAEVDPEDPSRAIDVVRGLHGVEACLDSQQGVAIAPPDGEQAVAVAEIEDQLVVATSMARAGRVEEAKAIALEAVERAEAIGYAPLLAAALREAGGLLSETSQLEQARDTLQRAAYWADIAADDRLRAEALSSLVVVTGSQMRDARQADGVAKRAEAVIARMDHAPEVAYRYETNMASYCYGVGRYAEGLAHAERAVKIATALQESGERLDFIGVLGVYATLLSANGHPHEATEVHRRVDAQLRELYGAHHPRVVVNLLNMALMQIGLRTFDDAEAGLAEALSLAAETRSVDNAVRGSLHAVMGEVLYRTGRLAEALESIERGRESWESVLAPGHVRFGLADSDRAVVLAKLGRTAEARQSVESARNTFERGVGLQYSGMRKVLWAEALIAESEGDLDGAEDVLRKWVDFSHEEGRSGAVEALLELARIQVRQRAYDRAEHSLLRARLLCDQSGECPAPELELLEERLGELR